MKKTRLEGGSSKFWQVELDGDEVTVCYGRIGTDGRTLTKKHASPAAALANATKQLAAKEAKGYERVGSAKTTAKKTAAKKTAAKMTAAKKTAAKKTAAKKTAAKKTTANRGGPRLPTGGRVVTLKQLEDDPAYAPIVTFLDDYSYYQDDDKAMLYEGDLEVSGDLLLDNRLYKRKPEKDVVHLVVRGDLRVEGNVLNMEGDYGIGLFVFGDLRAENAIFGGTQGLITGNIRLAGYGMAFYNHGAVICDGRTAAKGLIHHDNRFPGKPLRGVREAEWGGKGPRDASKVLAQELLDGNYPKPDRIKSHIVAGEVLFVPYVAPTKKVAKRKAVKKKAAKEKKQGPFGNVSLVSVKGMASVAHVAAKDGSIYRLAADATPIRVHHTGEEPWSLYVTESGVFAKTIGRQLHFSKNGKSKWTSTRLPENRLFMVTRYGTVLLTDESHVLHVSTDRGRRFSVAKVAENHSLYCIVAASPKVLFAVGRWVILRSDDGGASWRRVKRAGGPAAVYNEAFAFSEQEVLATGQWQSCAITTDGGGSWKAHKHPKEFGKIHSLTQLSDGRLLGLTGEKKPSMVVSKNLGRKWAPAPYQPPKEVREIWARDDDALILVGDGGYFEVRHV